jgi:hypothetical protein
MVVGVVNAGGVLPDHWVASHRRGDRGGVGRGLRPAREALASKPEDRRRGREARPPAVRRAPHRPQTLPPARAAKRSGLRLLTVGTDCSAGKKYTALAHGEASMRARGLRRRFPRHRPDRRVHLGPRRGRSTRWWPTSSRARSSGCRRPPPPLHWDVVEGQGSLFHPSFAGVTLGLLHGAQPDAFVDLPRADADAPCAACSTPLPSIRRGDRADGQSPAASLTNPAIIGTVGISINTQHLDEDQPPAPIWTSRRAPTSCRRPTRCASASSRWSMPSPSSTASRSRGRRPRPPPAGRTEAARTMASRERTVRTERWPIAGTFTISRGSPDRGGRRGLRPSREGAHAGRGECVPYARYGEIRGRRGRRRHRRRWSTAIDAGLERQSLHHRDVAGGGAQRGGLRAVGPRSEARGQARRGTWRACRRRRRSTTAYTI